MLCVVPQCLLIDIWSGREIKDAVPTPPYVLNIGESSTYMSSACMQGVFLRISYWGFASLIFKLSIKDSLGQLFCCLILYVVNNAKNLVCLIAFCCACFKTA